MSLTMDRFRTFKNTERGSRPSFAGGFVATDGTLLGLFFYGPTAKAVREEAERWLAREQEKYASQIAANSERRARTLQRKARKAAAGAREEA